MITEKNRGTEQQANTLTVLVADDDPPTRMLLKAAITQWGYHVLEVDNGEDAWDIIQKPNAPKLLILDWLMPKLDGITLCSRIKKDIEHRPYIILLTQVGGTANIIKGLEAGADEFLSKPFNMAELRSRLSVGARIIGYEIALAEQNIKLQQSISQIESLAETRAEELTKHTQLLIMLCMLFHGQNK